MASKDKPRCGARFTVVRAGRTWVKFCTRPKGHWGKHR